MRDVEWLGAYGPGGRRLRRARTSSHPPRIDAGSERERVSAEYPLDCHDGQGGNAHHECVEHCARTNEAAIKERESRHHQEHERRGAEDPRRVTGGRRRAHGAASWSWARDCTSSAVMGVSASPSRSPVRMRIT